MRAKRFHLRNHCSEFRGKCDIRLCELARSYLPPPSMLDDDESICEHEVEQSRYHRNMQPHEREEFLIQHQENCTERNEQKEGRPAGKSFPEKEWKGEERAQS